MCSQVGFSALNYFIFSTPIQLMSTSFCKPIAPSARQSRAAHQTDVHCIRRYSSWATQMAPQYASLPLGQGVQPNGCHSCLFYRRICRQTQLHRRLSNVIMCALFSVLLSCEATNHSTALKVPHGKYKSARSVKGRPDHIFNPDDSADSAESFSHLQYVAYDPGSSRSSRSTPSPGYNGRSLTWSGPSSDRSDPRRQAQAGLNKGHIRGQSLPESGSGFLAPLEYLETVTPPRRHPVDETALKLFRAGP
jgi:hypothetical protein